MLELGNTPLIRSEFLRCRPYRSSTDVRNPTRHAEREAGVDCGLTLAHIVPSGVKDHCIFGETAKPMPKVTKLAPSLGVFHTTKPGNSKGSSLGSPAHLAPIVELIEGLVVHLEIFWTAQVGFGRHLHEPAGPRWVVS